VRTTLVLAVLLAGTATLAACGDGPDPPVTPTELPTTPEPVSGLPILGPALQDLQFEGAVQGRMTDSSATCVWIHGTTPDKGRLQLTVDGLVGNERHHIRVSVSGYSGPGSYDWDGVPGSGPEVTIELDSKVTGHATINVDSPGGSGDIDGTLTTPTIGRVSGTWECPGVPR